MGVSITGYQGRNKVVKYAYRVVVRAVRAHGGGRVVVVSKTRRNVLYWRTIEQTDPAQAAQVYGVIGSGSEPKGMKHVSRNAQIRRGHSENNKRFMGIGHVGTQFTHQLCAAHNAHCSRAELCAYMKRLPDSCRRNGLTNCYADVGSGGTKSRKCRESGGAGVFCARVGITTD